MSENTVLSAVVALLESEWEGALRDARAASEAATDPDNKAENKYDTRALEASYLARGQAQRVAELAEAVAGYRALAETPPRSHERVVMGSCLTLKAPDGSYDYVMGPSEGGSEVRVGRVTYTLITPASPLGRKLLGLRVGDTVTLAAGKVPWLVTSIR